MSRVCEPPSSSRESVHRFKSAFLGNERTIWIRLPEGEAKAESLVVFLDGEFYRDRVGAPQIITELERDNALPPICFVFVSHESLAARWIECPCHPPFARFIDGELLPWLENLVPGVTSFRQRVLVGLSYTGLAAAYVAMEAPARFTKVIAQSGSFWSDDCELAERVRAKANPITAEFYLDVGVRETQTNVRHKEDVLQVVSQIEGVRRFRDALVATGNSPKYEEFAGAHEFNAWSRTLPEALRWALGTSDCVRRVRYDATRASGTGNIAIPSTLKCSTPKRIEQTHIASFQIAANASIPV